MTSTLFRSLCAGLCLVIVGCESATIDETRSLQRGLEVPPSPYWKDQLSFPDEPFAFADGQGPRWVKFSIDVADPTRVYFQDGYTYAFHYDFAKNHLPGYENFTRAQFEAVTLKAVGQTLVTGAVLFPPYRLYSTPEMGIQLIRQDAYSREDVKKYFDLVRSAVTTSGQPLRAYYFPTYEQAESAQAERDWLTANGIQLGSLDRWSTGDACYSMGWAFGTLRYFPGNEIAQAYEDGRLKSTDILLTDGVPAEVPFLAGILSLSPATPNSHAALISKTWGIPFAYPISEIKRAQLQALVGKEIVVRARSESQLGDEFCTLEFLEPKGGVDAATRAAIAALKRPPTVNIQPKATLGGALTKPVLTLMPTDVKYFGGKAANFGSLRRSIPNNSPNAVGISFDLWDAFLAQTLSTGKTLKEEIDTRLAGFVWPVDPRALAPKLEEIQDLIKDTAVVPPALKTQLLNELTAYGYDINKNLRFRSSTNVEDGEQLSGAGLYDSYSGCLADDLDADKNGPSICDPTEAKERGIFRAIQKVYASFYNLNAVMERIKYGIDENKVGMAMAVHPSFVDEIEAANGVATIHRQFGYDTILMVTQLGAESVTNPNQNIQPEIVWASVGGGGSYFEVKQGSSLVQLGAKVMEWEKDYQQFGDLMAQATTQFLQDYAGATDDVWVDVEYKKLTTGELVIKQIRHIVRPNSARNLVPVLFGHTYGFCTAPNEGDGLLASHRLKSNLVATGLTAELNASTLAKPLYSLWDWEGLEQLRRKQRTGAPGSFPSASHSVTPDALVDSWTGQGTSFQITSTFPRLMSVAEQPLLFTSDLQLRAGAKYNKALPEILSTPTTVTEESTPLERCVAPDEVSPVTKEIVAKGPKGVTVVTKFHYRKARNPFEKTATLGAWEKTEIKGLISRPIVLRDFWSQTLKPQHHNFAEDFVFDPFLEPNLPVRVRAELLMKDIRALVLVNASVDDPSSATFYVLRYSTGKLVKL